MPGCEFGSCVPKYVGKQRPGPGGVADGAREPVDAGDFTDLTHGVAAVAGALEGSGDGVLRVAAEDGQGESEGSGVGGGDGEGVGTGFDVGERAAGGR